MSVVPVANVLQGCVAVNNEVTVRGWIHTRRGLRVGVSFLTVYSGSYFNPVQAIINDSLPNYNEDALRLTTGCSVIMTGEVVALPGQGQQFEIQTSKVEIAGWVEDPDTYLMAIKRHSIKYLCEVAHLRPRTDLIGAIVRVRHTLAQALHRFFNEQGFFWVSTPLIIASDTGGTGEIFRVSALDLENLPHNGQGKIGFDEDLSDKEPFLTVSGQLDGETYTCVLSKICVFGPIFRAENSNISCHLAEFWILEPEVVLVNLDDIADLVGAILKYVSRAVLKEHADDMRFFAERVDKDAASRLERFIEADLVQMDYTDAVIVLENCGRKFENPVYWGIDSFSEHECYLAEEHFKAPVVIRNYPKDIRAFYVRLNRDDKTVTVMDVLALGIGEVTDDSQHEECLDVLDERTLETGPSKEDHWQYRDLRRYGTIPHSSLGLSFEYLIVYIIGIQNAHDVILFPCTPHNANFQFSVFKNQRPLTLFLSFLSSYLFVKPSNPFATLP